MNEAALWGSSFTFGDVSYSGRGRGAGRDHNRNTDLKRKTLITQWIYSNYDDTQHFGGFDRCPQKHSRHQNIKECTLHAEADNTDLTAPPLFAVQTGYFHAANTNTLFWQKDAAWQPVKLYWNHNSALWSSLYAQRGLKRTIPLEDELVILGIKGHENWGGLPPRGYQSPTEFSYLWVYSKYHYEKTVSAVDHHIVSDHCKCPYQSVGSNNNCFRFFWRSSVGYQKVNHPLGLYEEVAA